MDGTGRQRGPHLGTYLMLVRGRRVEIQTPQTWLTSFLFLLQVRQAPFLRTSAVSWGALNLRVLRVRIKASGWEDSDLCRRFLDLGFWRVSTGVSERESEEG